MLPKHVYRLALEDAEKHTVVHQIDLDKLRKE